MKIKVTRCRDCLFCQYGCKKMDQKTGFYYTSMFCKHPSGNKKEIFPFAKYIDSSCPLLNDKTVIVIKGKKY
jgi:hypothetical protein